MGSENIVPSEKMGLGQPPDSESKPLRLRISFLGVKVPRPVFGCSPNYHRRTPASISAPVVLRDYASSMNVESGMETIRGSSMAGPSSRVMSSPNGARLVGFSTNALMPRVSPTESMLRR